MSLKQIDGLPIINAKRPIKLTITSNDVKGGDAKEPQDCVVERACRRELRAKEVRVHLARIYMRTSEGSWTRYFTPQQMRSEIIAFDRGGNFAAGEYHLGAISPSKATGKTQGAKAKHRKSGKKRQKPHVVADVRMGPAG